MAAPQSIRSIRQNIDAVAKLEQEFEQNRTRADRIADAIGGFSGSLRFVVLHVVFYGSWIAINLKVIPWIHPFDPFPFMFLSMVVSLEAIFLSTFVLMKQNRMSKRADQRAHLDLQINLLSERELTQALRLLERLCSQSGICPPREVEELTEETSVEELATELREKLPDL